MNQQLGEGVPAEESSQEVYGYARPECRDEPELFFSNDAQAIKLAKEVCERCVLQDACLTASFELRELQYGVWGGLTPNERRQLASTRRTVQK